MEKTKNNPIIALVNVFRELANGGIVPNIDNLPEVDVKSKYLEKLEGTTAEAVTVEKRVSSQNAGFSNGIKREINSTTLNRMREVREAMNGKERE